MNFIKNKVSLNVFKVEVLFLKSTPKKNKEIKEKLLKFDSNLNKIILFSEESNKSLNALILVSSDISIENSINMLNIILNSYFDMINIIIKYPHENSLPTQKNVYSLFLASKYDYFDIKESSDILDNSFKEFISKKNTSLQINSILLTTERFMFVDFTLDSELSIISAIKMIKESSSYLINNKYGNKNNLWGNGFLESNYISLRGSEIIDFFKKENTQKEIDYEIDKTFDYNNVVIEQYSLFKNMA